MKAALRQQAKALGFDDCRVTTASPPESGVQFQQWLTERQHGEMVYLERSARKRLEPQQVLPGARSIITLAVSYAGDRSQEPGEINTKHQTPNISQIPNPKSDPLRERDSSAHYAAGVPESDRGRSRIPHPVASLSSVTPHASLAPHLGLIARYARYQDYHDVLAGRLKSLTDFVNQLGGQGTRSLWYVDTGPLLERDLAQRSGLGFIGKHTNLISRSFGNWIFLCEILTTLELEPDAPERNRCGSCTRCLAACPTNAIKAPFQLDARLCISYLTIELKGSIPVALRPLIGNRIYGCDDCLAVCPWNRFAREGQLMKGHGRPELAEPNLLELLAMDEGTFKRRFAGTPMLRTKRRGLLRNVCVALGNTADETALPALQKAASDLEPLIAEHARWAVEQINVKKALPQKAKMC
jgi:epoxyqueuosine reductase